MPLPNKYTKGFNLAKGLKIAGYELVDISVGHKIIKQYKKYQYPTNLTWIKTHNNANSNNLLNELKSYLGSEKIIYTRYHNPYECNFGKLHLDKESDGMVKITAVGLCERV